MMVSQEFWKPSYFPFLDGDARAPLAVHVSWRGMLVSVRMAYLRGMKMTLNACVVTSTVVLNEGR